MQMSITSSSTWNVLGLKFLVAGLLLELTS